jgi:hypothetical protein
MGGARALKGSRPIPAILASSLAISRSLRESCAIGSNGGSAAASLAKWIAAQMAQK